MANSEHFFIFKSGAESWIDWRHKNRALKPDLSGANLSNISFQGVVFDHVGDMGSVYFNVDLSDTDLRGANLSNSDVADANLARADLSGSQLRGARFCRANLQQCDLSETLMGNTVLADLDLSSVKGLDSVQHTAPSTIGINTLSRSLGKIPDVFLRGCGLTDWEIEIAKIYQPRLKNEELGDSLYRIHDLRAHQAIQVHAVFISYSHMDSSFVDELELHLSSMGIRYWRDIHHATAGRLERQVDRAIRLNPTVLLILSSNSVKSDWVQHEARLARKIELETGRQVLCPLALDASWKSCAWPERLREQIMEYNILDFSRWRRSEHFSRTFSRLLDGLDLFYK